jgi:hypothetical protein
MRESFIVIGLTVIALGLRMAHRPWLRKLGAFVFLGASFSLGYFLTGMMCCGMAAILLWFFLPWIELLTRIRRMRLPVENRLQHEKIPNPSFFPNAPQAVTAMEDDGFEHVSDCGWKWDGMDQYFMLYWNPEERAVSGICLCEQSDVAFAFITITSMDGQGRIWRTTNFPFAPTLLRPPDVIWNHVPCSKNCFHQILADHKAFLGRQGLEVSQLRIPDPEAIESSIETEMQRLVQYNLSRGIITLSNDGTFRYSKRGMLFLWGQFIKDMIRFC